MKNFIKSVVVVSGLFLCFAVKAQDSSVNEEQDVTALIAPYSSDVRDAILDVAQYPQKLVKVDRMQAGTSQSFKDLVAKYPRDKQEKFYDLSRYPDLINQLTETGNAKSRSEVATILAAYPKEISSTVNDLYPSHFSELQSMDRMFQQSESSMRDIIGSLPTQTQNNFIKVVAMPDVMKLLTERIDQTVSLGEAYRDDPAEVKKNLDELNSQVTAQNAKDLDDYKRQVASDPELQAELRNSSQEFATNYTGSSNAQPQVVNNYYYNTYTTNPYPYWFGYPYWYPTAVWYPRPLYYHTGFYVSGGNVIVVGLPSCAYSNWFFGYGYRRYPVMYRRYHSYYGYQYRPAHRYSYARRDHNYNGYNNDRNNYNRNNNSRDNNYNNNGTNYNNQPSRGRTGGETRYSPQIQQTRSTVNERSNGNVRQANPVTIDRSQSRGSFDVGSSSSTTQRYSRSELNLQRPIGNSNGGSEMRSVRPASGTRSESFGGMRSESMSGGSHNNSGVVGGGSRGSSGSSGGGRRGR